MHVVVSSSAVFRTKLHLPSDKFPWITPKGNLCIQNPVASAAVDAKRQECIGCRVAWGCYYDPNIYTYICIFVKKINPFAEKPGPHFVDMTDLQGWRCRGHACIHGSRAQWPTAGGNIRVQIAWNPHRAVKCIKMYESGGKFPSSKH